MANKKQKALKEEEPEIKPIQITAAAIKEGLCNYGYEIMIGPGSGDKIPTRKGSAEVHEDMLNAFQSLNVHLAIIDDAFKYSNSPCESIADMEGEEIAQLFYVNGFKIIGSNEDEGYVLIGEKVVSTGSISLETPKIKSASNYPFFDQLKESVEMAREEVELYMNGKAAPKFEQAELPFEQPKTDDADFDNPM